MISSGYQDFSYAKTAISLGVKEYLLKPVNPEEFAGLMQELAKQIEKEQLLRVPLQAAAGSASPRSLSDLMEYMASELSASEKPPVTASSESDSALPVPDSANGKVRFICDYISSQDASAVLPPMLVSALRTTVQSTEDHVCRLLFKLAVEVDMMMNVLAAGMEIPEEQMEALRPQCVRNVKRTHGMISLEDAAVNQSGG